MPMTPNTEQDWKVWRNLMWSEILTESVKSYMAVSYTHLVIMAVIILVVRSLIEYKGKKEA